MLTCNGRFFARYNPTMTFTDIYQRVLPHWPATISIADAVVIEPKTNTRKNQLLMPSKANSFYSATLSSALTKAREATTTNTFEAALVWAFFDLLNKRAQQLFGDGITELKPAEVDKAALEEKFFQSLEEEELADDWEKQL